MPIGDTFVLGEFVIDPSSREVTDGSGEVQRIDDKAMRVLLVLVENPGSLVTQRELLERVWGGALAASADSIAYTIGMLRQSFRDNSGKPRYIETVEDRGYRLVARLEPASPEPPPRAAATLWQELHRRKVFRGATLYAVGAFVFLQIFDATSQALPLPSETQRILLAVLVAGFPVVTLIAWSMDVSRRGVFFEKQTRRLRKFGRGAEVSLLLFTACVATIFVYFIVWAPTGSADPVRIAVLPFNNFTGDPANDYLGDGIAEELLDGLEDYDDLFVMAHSASFYFKNRQVDFTTIAARLNVDVIVEGSILDRQGNRIRVVAQLVDGKTGGHIWSNKYDLELKEFINVKHEISRMIVNALSVVLVPELRPGPLVRTTSTDAYDYYLQGLDYLRRYVTRQDQIISRDMFQRALEFDPEFHPALTGLCQIQLEMYVQSRNSTDYQGALGSCTRLIDSAGESVESLIALGTLNRLTKNITEAKDFFQKALALNPQNGMALHGLGRCFEALDEPAAAEDYLRRAVGVERTYWKFYVGYAGFLFRQGRLDDAAEQTLKMTELLPDNPIGWGNLGAIYFAGDKWEAAQDAWIKAFELKSSLQGYANLGTVAYYQHDFETARKWLEEGVREYPDNYRLLAKLAAVYRSQPEEEDKARATFVRAIEQTRNAITINPDDAPLLAFHGLFAANLGLSEEADKAINRALELSPDNPEFHYFRALISFLDSRSSDWRTHLDRALELGYSKRLAENDPLFLTPMAAAQTPS